MKKFHAEKYLYPPQTVFVGGYTVFPSDCVSEKFLCLKHFFVHNVLFL